MSDKGCCLGFSGSMPFKPVYCKARIAELEDDAHTKDAFYGQRIAELEAELAEAKALLVMPSDYWTGEEGEDFRKRRDVLLNKESGDA